MDTFRKAIASQPWRRRVVLRKLAEGAVFHEAAGAAGVSRQATFKWRRADPEFNRLVIAARKIGAERRTYLLWLRHPFRGRRPPTGKGHGGKPRFSLR